MNDHERALTAAELQRNLSSLIGPRLARLQSVAIMIAVAGAVLCLIGLVTRPQGFFHSYLVGLLFWVGAANGSLALLMLHHTTGGGWGYILRRFFEAGSQMILPMLVLCIPLFLGIVVYQQPYIWARPEITDPFIRGKAAFLNPGFFVARTVLYFAILGFFGWRMRSWAAILEQRDDPRAEWGLNVIGGFGMVVFVLVTTFLGVDWVMSLTPKWYSSIFGFILVVSQVLTALTLMVVLLSRLAGDQQIVRRDDFRRYFRDIGNLTLALIVLWAYMTFSQYLLQYSGNLVDEIAWYLPRRSHGWGWYSIVAIPLHFFLPFLVLLVGSDIKKNPNRLAKVAALILVFRILDIYWWIAPNFYASWLPAWADIGSLLLIGGIWLWGWAHFAGRAPTLVPVHDPRIELAMGEAAHHA